MEKSQIMLSVRGVEWLKPAEMKRWKQTSSDRDEVALVQGEVKVARREQHQTVSTQFNSFF